jgi:hypothetical protein
MYEHSYHIDYGAKAATYVNILMRAIRWNNADELFAEHAKAGQLFCSEPTLQRLSRWISMPMLLAPHPRAGRSP